MSKPNKRRKPLKVAKASKPTSTTSTKSASPRAPARHTVPPKPAKNKHGGRPNDLTWHPLFIKSLKATPNIAAACRAARTTWHIAHNHRDKFREFKEAWDLALAEGAQSAVGELHDRAVEGWREPVYQGGKMVGTVLKKSDTLLMFLLKSHLPATYGDKSKVEHSGGIVVQSDEETIAAAKALQESLISTLKAAAGLGKKEA